MNSKIIFILAIVSVLMLSACEKPAFLQEYLGAGEDEGDFTILPPGEGIDVELPEEGGDAVISEEIEEEEMEAPITEEDAKEEAPEEEPEEMEDTGDYVKKVVMEGDTVELTPQAVDPDGDEIEYTFSPPLDEDGVWETEKGDAGQYLVEITASDGRLETTQKILVVVQSTNKAPEITGLEDITVEEGETVELDFEVEDADGDDVTVEISGWMDENEMDTSYEDAGEYEVTVTATDGEDETEITITVTVEDVNRAPEFGNTDDVEAVEEDEVKLVLDVTDEDGDDLEMTYSDPFDEDGEWQTEEGDAGEYDVTVTASDGTETVEATVTVIITSANAAPVIEELDDIEVDEGETVEIEAEYSDEDGDDLEVTYSGWMDSATYETDFDDEGVYTVTVTVSDGKASVSRDVEITVNNVNRPPQFVLVG